MGWASGSSKECRAVSGFAEAVEDSKAADHGAIAIREQRRSDTVRFRKGMKNLRGVIADGRDAEAIALQHQTRLFQLDQLGAAVLSPIGAAIKDEQQAVGSAE